MNRFEYTTFALIENESQTLELKDVNLQDSKQVFKGGDLLLTSRRLFWGNKGDIKRGLRCLQLPLHLIVLIEKTSDSSCKLYLLPPNADKGVGPASNGTDDFIKISTKDKKLSHFIDIIILGLKTQSWTRTSVPGPSTIKSRTGILGIERNLEERLRNADQSISTAFKDLDNLMSMAKEMVKLSESISKKITDKQGHISEDETVQFKLKLMNLGISDPITRDSYKSDNKFYIDLAKQISDSLCEIVSSAGGMMPLTEVYCRINRARGLDLLSPQDVLNACTLMESLELPLSLYEFNSGVKVLQFQSLNEENVNDTIVKYLAQHENLTPEQFSSLMGITLFLAKEMLTNAEKCGRICRDSTIQGITFYPNLFLTRDD